MKVAEEAGNVLTAPRCGHYGSQFVSLLVAVLLWALKARRWLHLREYASDRWAAERGGALTDEIARRAYAWPHPWRRTIEALWGTHPAIFRRVSRVSGTVSAESR
jgi:hypothetical protein